MAYYSHLIPNTDPVYGISSRSQTFSISWLNFISFIHFLSLVLTYCFFPVCALNIKSVSDSKKYCFCQFLAYWCCILVFFSYFNSFLVERMLVLFPSNLCCSYIYNISSTVISFLPTTSYYANSETRLN